MRRRRYVARAAATAAAALAGCLGDGNDRDGARGADPSVESATEENETGEETNGERDASDDAGGDHPALEVLDAYVAAAIEGDLETVATRTHSASPFGPEAIDEIGERGLPYESVEFESYDRELVDGEFDADDVRDVPGIESWFDAASLEALLEGEAAALVEASYEPTVGDGGRIAERFVVLTEGGDWKVFLPYEEPTAAVPDGDPIDDERYRIVDGVEYDSETEMATVRVSGVSAVEAAELVAYSERLGEGSRIWSADAETLPPTRFLAVPFDADGDEIVVAVAVDGEELVIHRDAYEP